MGDMEGESKAAGGAAAGPGASLVRKRRAAEARRRAGRAGKLSRRRRPGLEARAGSEDWAPAVLAAGALLCVLLPVWLLFQGGLPEPEQLLDPPSRHLPSKSVTKRPREGVHFSAGNLTAEGRAIGPWDSPHHVVEFTDFFCSHCQESHRRTMLPLMETYVPTGSLRLESHPVAFLDGESLRAAHAVLCAQEQHKYWEMRELLFQVDLDSKPAGADTVFNAAMLKRLASLAELDLKAFARCFHSGRHQDEVRRISKTARRIGVHGTPHFIFNHAHREGVVDPSEFPKLLGVLHSV